MLKNENKETNSHILCSRFSSCTSTVEAGRKLWIYKGVWGHKASKGRRGLARKNQTKRRGKKEGGNKNTTHHEEWVKGNTMHLATDAFGLGWMSILFGQNVCCYTLLWVLNLVFSLVVRNPANQRLPMALLWFHHAHRDVDGSGDPNEILGTTADRVTPAHDICDFIALHTMQDITSLLRPCPRQTSSRYQYRNTAALTSLTLTPIHRLGRAYDIFSSSSSRFGTIPGRWP